MRDYVEDLKRQLRFIENSAKLFDGGQAIEALRIATTIRVLIHDTKRQTSLLKHLGIRSSIRLLSTAGAELVIPSGVVFSMNIGVARVGPSGTSLGVGPDDPSRMVEMSVDDWWSQHIWKVNGAVISRRDLILTAANKDGGAHVDAETTEEYRQLVENGWGGMIVLENPDLSASSPNLGAIRAIGEEILRSQDLRALCTD